MSNTGYRRDARKVNELLESGIKTAEIKIDEGDGKTVKVQIDRAYFINLIKELRNQQVDALVDKSGHWITSILEKENRDTYDDTSRNFVFYYLLEPIIEEMKNWGNMAMIESLTPPIEASFVWLRIAQIERTPKKINVFLAWLWRDHPEVATKFYDDIGLPHRPYHHPQSIDYSQQSTDGIKPIIAQPIANKENDENIAIKIPQGSPDIRPSIRFTPTKASKDNPFHEELVTYQGRRELLDQLESFASNEDVLKLWAISGSSGSGKTRLSHEWMRKSETMTDWDQIILGVNHDINNDHRGEFWEQWMPDRSTLLVIDYLYVYADAFNAMLMQCMALIKKGILLSSKKVRILLIDHVFPKTLDELLEDNRMKFCNLDSDDRHKLLFNDGQPLDLDAINDLDTIMPLILRETAGAKVDDSSVQGALDHLKSMEKQKAWHPLFAVLIGYTLQKAQEEGQQIDVTAWNRRQLIEHYLTKDKRKPWKLNVDGAYASAFIAVATARRGVNFDFLTEHIVDHKLADSVDYNQVEQLCKTILSVPAIPERLPPFEPDILGETFFLLFLEAMQKDRAFLGAFKPRLGHSKAPFTAMLSEGDEEILPNDAEEFIGFIARLTRNLCNDDQNGYQVNLHWKTLLTFLNPKKFPAGSPMRWAVSGALVVCATIIKRSHPDKRKKEFELSLQQVEIDILYQNEQNEKSLIYAMQYYEWINQK